MNKPYQLVNGAVGFDKSNRQWLSIDKPLVISESRQIHLMANNPDAVLVERLNGQHFCHYQVRDSHWINLPTRHGFTEIIPKGVRFDKHGHAEAVLIELVEIPAQQVFSQ